MIHLKILDKKIFSLKTLKSKNTIKSIKTKENLKIRNLWLEVKIYLGIGSYHATLISLSEDGAIGWIEI